MSKRLVKIPLNDLPAHTNELIGKTVNVVLKSNQTFYGQCERIENTCFVLRDFRKHAHQLAFTQIESVIYDKSATF